MAGRLAGALMAAILCSLAAVAAAAGADKVLTRAWDHKSFGRIVFDWPAAVDYAAEIADGTLLVRFDRPLSTSFDVVKLNLARYVAGARYGETRRSVVFTLKQAFDLKTHRNQNKVVIDLWWEARQSQAENPPGDAGPAAADVPEASPEPQVPVRFGAHDGFSRLVFDWPDRVDYRVTRQEGRALVTFDRPADLDLKAIESQPLPRIGNLRPRRSDGVLAVEFAVPEASRLRSFHYGTKIVLDVILPDTAVGDPETVDDAQSPPAPERMLRVTQAAPATHTAEAEPADPAVDAMAKPQPPIRVPIRSGEHPGFSRLVFDWTELVEYRVTRRDDRAHVTFDRPADVDLKAINRTPPLRIRDLRSRRSAGALELDFAVPENSRLRNFRNGTKIVLDVLAPERVAADEEAALGNGGVPEADLEPAAGPEPEAVTAAPSPPVQKADPSPPVQKADPLPLVQKTDPLLQARKADSLPTVQKADPLPPVRKADPLPPVQKANPLPPVTDSEQQRPTLSVADNGDDRLVLSFDWPMQVAAAAFRRAGFVWLIFDRPASFELSQVRRAGTRVLEGIEQVPNLVGTVLRLATPRGINPTLRRAENGTGWIVELRERPLRPTDGIEVAAVRPMSDADSGAARLVLPIEDSGDVVEIRDPEIGDTLFVIPVREPGYGVDSDRAYVEFRLLRTVQGVVIEPRTDTLALERRADGIGFLGADALLISARPPVVDEPVTELAHSPPPTESSEPAVDTGEPEPKTAPRPEAPSSEAVASAPLDKPLFDFTAWRAAGLYASVRQTIHRELADAPPDQRSGPRLRLARISMAYGIANDALAALDSIAAEDPVLDARHDVRALRGAALYLTGQIESAAQVFAEPVFDRHREAAFWRAIFAAANDQDEQAVLLLRRSGFLPSDYPSKLRADLELIAAEAAIDAADLQLAKVLLDDLLKFHSSREQRAEIDFLRARLLYQDDDVEGALEIWEDLALSRARRTAARAALTLVVELRDQERIDAREAIERLERLRFAWRGDQFEFNVLRRLGSLYLDVGEHEKGLVALRQAVTYFPERKAETTAVARQMTAAFVGLFGPEASQAMPPLKALALYDQFRELTPAGTDGDLMTQRLAERLVKVDLLGRAGDLLEHQVNYRLAGEDKARIGARLAQIRFADRQSDRALEALQASAVAELPQDLIDRRQRLEARVRSSLDDHAGAIALLDEDHGREAGLLRAEFYRRQEDWKKTSETLAGMVETAFPQQSEPGEGGAELDDDTAQLILELAVATVLDRDMDGLVRLRERYGEAMEQRPEGEAFALIASASEPPHDPRALTRDPAGIDRFRAYMAKYRERLAAGRTASSAD